jgi:5,10-methylenetetrahydromethanopterin reductase
MKFGWLLLGTHSRSDIIKTAQECDRAEFDILFVCDDRFLMDTYSMLTLCTINTKRIRLGPGVTNPYMRHPALTTMAIATLDHFSDGRAVLGLGAGHSGFHELHIDRDRPSQAIRETVKIVRALLAGEKVSYQGKVIQVRDCELGFTPLGQVPIIVGSNGQLIIRVAGEVADGVMSSSVLVQPRINEVQELVDQGLQISGRKRNEFSVWSRLNIALHPDRKLAIRALKPMIYSLICNKYPDTGMFDRMGLSIPEDLRYSIETVKEHYNEQEFNRIRDQLPDEFIEKTCLMWTPKQVIQQIKELDKAGFDGVVLCGIPTENQSYLQLLRLINREVISGYQNALKSK